ncbi:MAG: adenylyltransferase [Actinomycetota bacterium]|jgi:ATP adenylyltransferase|nr:adenylyltransferase [Actinomycetota bacterium]
MEYVTGAGNSEGCIFCDHLARDDDAAAHILFRGESAFVLLNAFPYNTGHLMVAPLRHVAKLHDLDPAERSALMELTSRSIDIVQETMSPDGFNVGMNLGNAAGAGVPGHLHVHVVPRWGGDTNFMSVVGETKVLPEMLADTDAKLRPRFAALQPRDSQPKPQVS